MAEYDFSCYILKYEVDSIRGLKYKKDLFASQDGNFVPLVWNYQHFDPGAVLGHVVLENKPDGLYAYCYLSNTPNRKIVLELMNDTSMSLGPFVTGYKVEDKHIVKGKISSCSLMFERIDDDEAYHPILNKDKEGELYGKRLFYLFK